jgi:hypothetical protein
VLEGLRKAGYDTTLVTPGAANAGAPSASNAAGQSTAAGPKPGLLSFSSLSTRKQDYLKKGGALNARGGSYTLQDFPQ